MQAWVQQAHMHLVQQAHIWTSIFPPSMFTYGNTWQACLPAKPWQCTCCVLVLKQCAGLSWKSFPAYGLEELLSKVGDTPLQTKHKQYLLITVASAWKQAEESGMKEIGCQWIRYKPYSAIFAPRRKKKIKLLRFSLFSLSSWVGSSLILAEIRIVKYTQKFKWLLLYNPQSSMNTGLRIYGTKMWILICLLFQGKQYFCSPRRDSDFLPNTEILSGIFQQYLFPKSSLE